MRSGCPFPEHHGHHPGSGMPALVALLVIFLAVIARPVIRTAEHVLEIALVCAGMLGALALAVTVAVVVVRRRRRRAPGLAVVMSRQVTILPPAQSSFPAAPVVADLPQRAPLTALPGSRIDSSTHSRENTDAPVVTGRTPRPRCTRRVGRWS